MGLWGTNMEPKEIFNKAWAVSNKAAHDYNATLPPEQQRGFTCGFAWVTIHPARGPFVSWLKKRGIGSRAYGGGYQLWYSELHTVPTQSVDVHEKAANAFAKVLKEHGITAYSGSRLD